MHKVLKAFPCSFDGIHSEKLAIGDERDFGTMAEGLKKAGLIGEIDAKTPAPKGGATLREDGPTVTEFVARGYLATNYPPTGYASRSTPEEIEAAIKEQKEVEGSGDAAEAAEALRAELKKLLVPELRDKAAELKIQLAENAKKDDIIDALVVAGTAPQP